MQYRQGLLGVCQPQRRERACLDAEVPILKQVAEQWCIRCCRKLAQHVCKACFVAGLYTLSIFFQ